MKKKDCILHFSLDNQHLSENYDVHKLFHVSFTFEQTALEGYLQTIFCLIALKIFTPNPPPPPITGFITASLAR